jgi:hypothetical protein
MSNSENTLCRNTIANLHDLQLSTNYAAVAPGSNVFTTVIGLDPNTGVGSPYGGASMAGTKSDANGVIVFQALTHPGC